MLTKIWMLLVVHGHIIYASQCPQFGLYCKPINPLTDNEPCSAVKTKRDCIKLMKIYPCVWSPHDNLPNNNYVDLETMKFVEERKWIDSLERVHDSFPTKPNLYRFDDCGFVYALNHRDDDIFERLPSSSYFAPATPIENDQNPTYYNSKYESIKNIGLLKSFPPRPYRLYFHHCL